MLFKPLKFNIRDKKDVPRLEDLKMTVTTTTKGKSKITYYTWWDNGQSVAKFGTFDWWDGKNICDLMVYEKYRKRGYSYQLLDYATKQLGCKALAVEKDNKIARHVYEKYGFKKVDADDRYYYMYI